MKNRRKAKLKNKRRCFSITYLLTWGVGSKYRRFNYYTDRKLPNLEYVINEKARVTGANVNDMVVISCVESQYSFTEELEDNNKF